MNIDTLCLHATKNDNSFGAIATPIYQSATFAHVGEAQYSYSRLANPTRTHLEEVVAKLENGYGAFAFSTGMSAVSAVFQLFDSNDHIIASDDLYGGTLRLFRKLNTSSNITFSSINTSNMALIEQSINKNTKAIYLETPSNPLMQVSDIKAISKIAKENNLLLIVDNTFLTPYFQRPIDLGADIVIHSGTKYLGGHNDTLAGFIVTKDESLYEKIGYISKTIGAVLSPFDSFLIERGIKTLAVRMDKINENAKAIAKWLKANKNVKKLYYVGDEDHPQYNISIKQATGFGGMISFEVTSEDLAKQILNKVKIFQFAESLGGVESLITYPLTQTHADVPKEERDARGINEGLLRLSIGIENIDDLIDDLTEAFR